MLLQLNQLLLKPGNLLMAIPQLLQRIHQGVAVDSGQGLQAGAAATGQAVAVGLQILAIQPFQQGQSVFAVGVLPAPAQPLLALLPIGFQLLVDAFQPVGRQQGLQAPGQLLHQLVTIQAKVEQLGVGQGLMLRGEMAITLQELPVLAEMVEESNEAAGLSRVQSFGRLNGCVQWCVGRIGQVEFVVPERQQPFPWVPGDCQA